MSGSASVEGSRAMSPAAFATVRRSTPGVRDPTYSEQRLERALESKMP